ncbi:MAG: N-6 DNA methylase [Senegalimassilia sp.]|nr:N-6 DNA methylase [Senegalimassilia sp.]
MKELSNGAESVALAKLLEAARVSENEEQLKINAEDVLRQLCVERGVFWSSYTYERSFNSGSRRVDAVHGSTIIEYEPPRSFRGGEGSKLDHARQQAEEYASLLSSEEGRCLNEYSLVAWDGATISFGFSSLGGFSWEPARNFDESCLKRLVDLIADGGRPLVSPMLLKQLVGPDTLVGRELLPALYEAIVRCKRSSSDSRAKLIYAEWVRLFGQVDGTETERLEGYLEDSSRQHGIAYTDEPQAYVFALSTYIALVAKVCAVYSLAAKPGMVVGFTSSAIDFLKEVEEGECFRLHGIENMLGTDFFSWYLGDDVAEGLSHPLEALLERLRTIDFDVTRKKPESVRDLFKGLYMEFTPAAMRHALGEYYTPDWLASHVVDVAGWDEDESLLDPTCGSGTFLLEGLRRRLDGASANATARELLEGIYGFDLNPLAVLTAKASIVVFLSGRFDGADPVILPVFLADAINTADPVDGVFKHAILTEKGERRFAIPEALARANDFFSVMDHLRVCIDANLDCGTILESLRAVSSTVAMLEGRALAALKRTIRDLLDLHRNHWNGIWCLILFDRIEAGCVRDVSLVAGNPPWVKWSNLPRPYAEFIKPICDRMDIFSEDSWVGGIQSDISTVVTYRALERFVAPGGSLAFLITGTVFKNESSQGFRRWELRTPSGVEPIMVEMVEDYALLRPFDGVSNWPTLLLVRRNGEETRYPLEYRRYVKAHGSKPASNRAMSYDRLRAMPVPGTDAGPWLVGGEQEVEVWPALFDAASESSYRARKGVTTDMNGVYFVSASPAPDAAYVRICNDPRNGRRRDVVEKKSIIERDDVFPLLRGRDVGRFSTKTLEGQSIIIPQRGMFGDEDLPQTRPRTFRYLCAFRSLLEQRSSYRRFQKGKPFWSVWSTGDYTFAPWKVVWKEMSGAGFAAAYVGSSGLCGEHKTVVPDHKVYFVPMETEEEAAYLTAFLNAGIVANAVSAYASALSLGASVVDYLAIPEFDRSNEEMMALASLAKRFNAGEIPSCRDEEELNRLVKHIIGL